MEAWRFNNIHGQMFTKNTAKRTSRSSNKVSKAKVYKWKNVDFFIEKEEDVETGNKKLFGV